MKIIQYEIAWGADEGWWFSKKSKHAYEVLEQNIEILLFAGFQPFGNLVQDYNTGVLYQPMVKYKE